MKVWGDNLEIYSFYKRAKTLTLDSKRSVSPNIPLRETNGKFESARPAVICVVLVVSISPCVDIPQHKLEIMITFCHCILYYFGKSLRQRKPQRQTLNKVSVYRRSQSTSHTNVFLTNLFLSGK